MSDITQENDDLSTTQEYTIAGLVLLLFGFLYLLFNFGLPSFTFPTDNTPSAVSIENTPTSSQQNKSAGHITPTQRMPLSDARYHAAEAANPTEAKMVTDTHSEPDNHINKMTQGQAVITTQQKPSVQSADTSTNNTEAAASITNSATNTINQQQNLPAQNTQANDTTTTEATDTKQTSSVVITDRAVLQLLDYLLNGDMEKPVLMESITFADKSKMIKVASERQVQDLAVLMQQYPNSKILIRGHSANEGSLAESKQLSLLRANAMGEQLVAAGGIAGNIIIMGMGSTEPLSANTTRRGREKNRRIDIAITQ